MCINGKAKQTFLQHLLVTVWHVVRSFKVFLIPVLTMKIPRIQISHKPVVQACDAFIILMHTSKGEQINFKFKFIQFRLGR